MKPILTMLGNDRDLQTLAGILCNRVRIDIHQTDIVHLLMDGYSDNNLHAVERWLRNELWKRARDKEPVNVSVLADRLLQQLIQAQADEPCS